MTRLLFILTLLSFQSHGQKIDKSKGLNNSKGISKSVLNMTPFEFTIYDTDYSMAYALQYILTDKNLRIIFKGKLEGEKDSTLFKIDLQPNRTLKKLSNINLDNLKENYTNPCVMDGSQVTVILKKNNKTKTVYLSNYYLADIGLAIELINSFIPENYKIWYDKTELLRNQERCK